MYFEDRKAILLHVPKTAGNTITSKLLQYSSDHMLVHGHQDGFDRFEIMGDVTPHKHATLQDYYDVLGDRLYEHKVIITVRHPVDRAVSLYFSPHRGMKLTLRARACKLLAHSLGVDVNFGKNAWRYNEPDFSLARFKSVVESTLSISDFLKVNGQFQMPALMIRQDDLHNDFARLCSLLELPEIRIDERRNVSKASRDEAERARNDRRVWDVCLKQFADDFELLEIEPPRN